MKSMQKIISGWLAFCLMLSMLPVQVFAVEDAATIPVEAEAVITAEESQAIDNTWGENLSWEFDESTGKLTISGTGIMKFNDENVPWNTYDEKIIKVVISEGVESIGNYAFDGCGSLTEISIPESIFEIGGLAFKDCTNLTNITIPNSVESIGPYAFWNCEKLTSIDIPEGVQLIDMGTFMECVSLHEVVLHNGLLEIGYEAFRDCSSLTNISIPDSVVKIADGAFYYCASLETLVIPDSVTTVEGGIFNGCSSLKHVSLPNSIETIGNVMFAGCSSLESIELPESVTFIDIAAFSNCTSLKEILIPNNVITIERNAFGNCNNLTDVYYTGSENQWSTIVIDSYNDALINATIHFNYDKNDDGGENSCIHTFENDVCTVCGITGGVLENDMIWTLDSNGMLSIIGIREMHDFALVGKGNDPNTPWYDLRESITGITVSEGITHIGNWAFCDMLNAASVTLPDGLVSMGNGCLSGCSSLTEVLIPSNVVSIGASAFNNCENLINVEVPDGVARIEKYTFCNCNKLPYLTIPEEISFIGQEAFYCTSLVEVRLPENVTVVSYGAFWLCAELYAIYIPAGVTSIEDYAFHECSNLADVYFGGTEEQWNAITIGTHNEALELATIHFNSKESDVHQHNYTATVYKPTCTERGYTTYTCDCGRSYVDDYVAAIGHGYDSGTVTAQPSCDTTGVMTYTCANDESHTYTETIPPSGHIMGQWYETIAPTTETDGEEQRDCENCDHSETRAIEKLLVKDDEGSCADGHDVIEILHPLPTCTEGSFARASQCRKCGEYISIFSPSLPLGHDWRSIRDGLYCSRCETNYLECISAHYYHSWDDISETAHFDTDGILSIQAKAITDEVFMRDPEDNIWEYVLVEILERSDRQPDILMNVIPIDSHIGTVTEIKDRKYDQTITVNENIYTVTVDSPSVDGYLNQTVIYQVYDGFLVGINPVETKEGVLTYWNAVEKNIIITNPEDGEIAYHLSTVVEEETISRLGSTGAREVTVTYVCDNNGCVHALIGDFDFREESFDATNNVRYFTKWDTENKIAYFDTDPEEDVFNKGCQVTDETDTSFLADVDDMVGNYVLVDSIVRTDGMFLPDTLISIKAVDVRIGKVTAANINTIVIDGVTYTTPADLMFADTYVGETVRYFLYNGVLIDLEECADAYSLSVRYLTKYEQDDQGVYFGILEQSRLQITDRTDISFKEDLDNLLNHYVLVEVNAKEDNSSEVLSITPVQSNVGIVQSLDTTNVTIDEKTFLVDDNADLTALRRNVFILYHTQGERIVGAEILHSNSGKLVGWNDQSRELKFESNDTGKVDYILSDLADQKTLDFLNGLKHDGVFDIVDAALTTDRQGFVYQAKEYTPPEEDPEESPETPTETPSVDVPEFNEPKYEIDASELEKLKIQIIEYVNEIEKLYHDPQSSDANTFVNALLNVFYEKIEISSEMVKEQTIKKMADDMKAADDESNSKLVTCSSTKYYDPYPVYEALAQIYYEQVSNKYPDATKIDLTNWGVSRFLNDAIQNISKYDNEYFKNGKKFKIHLTDNFGMDFGIIYYDGVPFVICATEDMCKNALKDCLVQMDKLAKKMVNEAVEDMAKSIFGTTLSSMAKKCFEQYAKDFGRKFDIKFQTILEKCGLGNLPTILDKLSSFVNTAKKIEGIMNADDIEQALKNIRDFEIEEVKFNDKAVEKCYKKLKSLIKQAQEAATEYLTGVESENNKSNMTLTINCPIEISVYSADRTQQIGFVGEDDCWYDDTLIIEKMGKVKRFHLLTEEIPLFIITATDEGTMSCCLEEKSEDSNQASRILFYDIPLTTGKEFELQPLRDLQSNSASIVISSCDETFSADQLISTAERTAVAITCDEVPEEIGAVYGTGIYAKGDIAKLYAESRNGYSFVGWYDGNELLNDSSVYEFLTKNDKNITPKFVKTNLVNIRITNGSGGTAMGDGTVEIGTTVTATALADDGYDFSGWYHNGELVSVSSLYNFMADSDISLESRFMPHSHKLVLRGFQWEDNFSCYGIFNCIVCTHETYMPCTVTSVTVPETESDTGEIIYTAVVQYNSETYMDTKVLNIPTVGHSTHIPDVLWISDKTNHWHKCTGCDERLDLTAHSGGTATCASPAICSVCGDPYGNKDSANHTGETEIRSAKDAEEFEEGYTGDTYCLGCGALLKKGTVIPATHIHVYAESVMPSTCLEEGYTSYTCSCGDCYNDNFTDPLGHTEEAIPEKPASCIEAGLTEGTKCSVCNEILLAQEDIPATGHKEISMAAIAPTCLRDGLAEGIRCETCGIILKQQETDPKIPHTEVVLSAVAPSCTETGLTDGLKCSLCNKIIVVQEVIPATGHTYDNNVDGNCNSCGVHREEIEIRQVTHMFRMYNPNTGEHFYTGSEEEKSNLVAVGWQYEGVGFTFPANTGAPVHRLFQPSTGEHLYTMDEDEKARLMADGWNYEGIAFNSAYDTEAVQHRLHNPNATVGAYHFTFSEEEKQNLIDIGWEYQGIGWYSCWK